MKKVFYSLMAIAAVATNLVSCTKEVNNEDSELVIGKMKTVTVKSDIETRTTLDADHVNLSWVANDKISIFNDVDNTNLDRVYEAGGDLIVSVPAATEEIYAHYPYFSGNESGPTSVSVYIGNNQTQKNPGELNGYNYPMVAKGTIREETQGEETVYKAIVSFYPVASALALNIYHSGLSGTETVKSVTVIPSSNNTGFIGKQITDLTANNIKYTSAELSTPITVTLTNPLILGSTKPTDKQKFAGQIYVCLAKQSYANVTFKIETSKGTYTISSNATPFDCVNNDFVPVNINLAKAEFDGYIPEYFTLASSVAAGDKIIFTNGTEGEVSVMKHYSTSVNSGNSYGYVSLSTDEDGLIESTVDVAILTVSKDGDNYVFYDSSTNKYLNATNDTGNNVLKASSSVDDYAKWSLGFSDSKAIVTCVGKNTRNVIRYNARFSCYSSGQQDIYIFKKITPKVLSSITLTTPQTLVYYVGDDFVFDGTVMANYEDGTSEDVTNKVTVTGYDMMSVGTQEITVSYHDKTATYNITVNAKPVITPNPITGEQTEKTIAASDPNSQFIVVYFSYVIANYIPSIGDKATVEITEGADWLTVDNCNPMGEALGGIIYNQNFLASTNTGAERVATVTFSYPHAEPVVFTVTQSRSEEYQKTEQVLFHESFGDNAGSIRPWSDSYSVKSGIPTVYSSIISYGVTNAKQGKNTTGSTLSGLNQTTAGTDAVLVIGPLNVKDAEGMVLTYQWKAASIKGTYSTSLFFATSEDGVYTEVSGTGEGATGFVQRSYSLPADAQVSTLYLKIVWNTSNTQAIIDEVDLYGLY